MTNEKITKRNVLQYTVRCVIANFRQIRNDIVKNVSKN